MNQSRVEIKKSDLKNEQSKRAMLFSVVLAIVLIAIAAWILVNKNRKLLRKNYENMIDKLKKESALSYPVNEEEAVDFASENSEEADLSGNKILIPTETETRILRRLSAFEKSEKYLKKDLTIGLVSALLNTNSKYLAEVIKKK